MKIYVASSWRNMIQPEVVAKLREAGHEVYDFKNPAPGNNGFHWSEIDGGYQSWSPTAFRSALSSPIAEEGFKSDMDALEACDACVLVLPCNKSAHLELGWAAGAGKQTYVFMPEEQGAADAELMYKMCDAVLVSYEELISRLAFEKMCIGAPTHLSREQIEHFATKRRRIIDGR